MRKVCLAAGLPFILAWTGFAQSPAPPVNCDPTLAEPSLQSIAPPKSLGEVARQLRRKTPSSSKLVITEENLVPARKTLFPDIALEDDNSDVIVSAMVSYRFAHSPEDTERAIRDWYSDQDYVLASLIRNIQQTQQRQADRQELYNYYTDPDPDDYQRQLELRRMQARVAKLDQSDIQSNTRVVSRLQDGLNRVRGGLQRNRVFYTWFKIRNQYGYNSY